MRIRVLGFFFILIGVGIAFYPAFTDVRSWLVQSRLRAVVATGEPSVQARAAGADVSQVNSPDYSLLEIPSIGLSAVVVEGTGAEELSKGPGRFLESALPGEGNTAIAGHRTMYGGWFRNLYRLKPGDSILLKLKGATYRYEVERVFTVLDNDSSIIGPCGYPALTLMTCNGLQKSEKRLAVRARLIGISPKQST